MRPSIPLLAGLALGCTTTFAVRHFTSPPPPSSASASSDPSHLIYHPSSILLPPRLTDPDASAALTTFLALGEAQSSDFATQSRALRALLTVLPDSHLPRLLGTIITREGDTPRRLRQITFDIWNERSPADAAQWAADTAPLKTFDARARNRLAQQAAKTWAATAFDPAFAWACAVPDPELSRLLASSLLTQLAATDPARALALAQSRGPEFLQAAQSDLFDTWTKVDPAAAVQALGAPLLEADRNNWRLREALGAWAAKDARAAVDWMLTQPGDPSRPWDSLMRTASWGIRENPAAQRAFADALLARTDSPTQFADLSAHFDTWAQKDTAAALAWAKSLPDAAQRIDLLERSVPSDHSDLRDADRYLPLALELPPGQTRDAKISGLLSAWARTDPDAALAWLSAHDDPSLAAAAERVQGSLVGALAATDPAAAVAAWSRLPSAESRSSAVPALAKAWAKTDPAAASRWMFDQLPAPVAYDQKAFEALPPESRAAFIKSYQNYQTQSSGFADTAALWFVQDPVAALDWAQALPDPKKRAAALEIITSASAPFASDVPDPVARATVLATVTDPALRDQALANHLRPWLRSDLASARAWIESNDALSPEAAARLYTETGLTP